MNMIKTALGSSMMILAACAVEPSDGVAPRDGSSVEDDLTTIQCAQVEQAHPGVHGIDCTDPGPDDMADSTFDPKYCAELDARARRLVPEHMTCNADMHCTAVASESVLGESCAPAFACYLPESTLSARPQFVDAALAIDAEYAEACGCPIADCVDPDYTYSTCEDDGRCEIFVDEPIEPRLVL